MPERGRNLEMTFLYYGLLIKIYSFTFTLHQGYKPETTMGVTDLSNHLEFLDLKRKWENGKKSRLFKKRTVASRMWILQHAILRKMLTIQGICHENMKLVKNTEKEVSWFTDAS